MRKAKTKTITRTKKQSKKAHVIFILLGASTLIALAILNLPRQFKNLQTDTDSNNNEVLIMTSQPTPTIVPPDFSDKPVQTRNQFDLSSWKTFNNEEVGLQFKYPSDWGTPKVNYNFCHNKPLCSTDNQPAAVFRLEFPNSSFTIGGASKNFSPSRGTNMLYDFPGFGRWKKEDLVKFCATPWFINCTNTDDIVHYTTTPACMGEPGSGFGYERVMLLSRSSGSINGLAFGGKFIPDDIGSPYHTCDDVVEKSVGNAILARKLSPSIMKTFDLYEKVFETVSFR